MTEEQIAKLFGAAVNEGREALRVGIRERKSIDGILRHRYSNERDFELHELYDMGVIEEVVRHYQRQNRNCFFEDILRQDIHFRYEGEEPYVMRLVGILIEEGVLSLDKSSGRYTMSNTRKDEPVLMSGRQRFPSFRF